MNVYATGYVYCISFSVIAAMIAILLSTEVHISQITSTKLEEQQKEKIVEISPDASYSLSSYDFRSNRLHEEVENRKLYLFEDYLRKRPKGIPMKEQLQEYSSIHCIETEHSFSLILMQNVCYDSESNRVILFNNDHLDKVSIMNMQAGLPREHFFAVLNGKFPLKEEDPSLQKSGNYLFLADDSMDLVSQFSSVSFLVHFAHHPTFYPSLLHAFFPFVGESPQSDFFHYLSSLQAFYPAQRSFDIYYQQDLPSGLLCFRELTIPTLLSASYEGFIHTSFVEAETARLAAYAYYHYDAAYAIPKTTIVLHIISNMEKKKEIGSIENMDEVNAFYAKKIAIWKYRSLLIDAVSRVEKIRQLYETDILFSMAIPHLVNMIYLLPGSCVVAINYGLVASPHYNAIAEMSQLFYQEVDNFTVSVPHVCKEKGNNLPFHIYSDRCYQELTKQNVYVQPGMLMSYLRVAKTHVEVHKYYDPSEGEYNYL